MEIRWSFGGAGKRLATPTRAWTAHPSTPWVQHLLHFGYLWEPRTGDRTSSPADAVWRTRAFGSVPTHDDDYP